MAYPRRLFGLVRRRVHLSSHRAGIQQRMVKEIYGATSEGDWYDIESNSIINESHERYGNEETGWQLLKAQKIKRYVQYRTVDEPVNYRSKEDQDERAKH